MNKQLKPTCLLYFSSKTGVIRCYLWLVAWVQRSGTRETIMTFHPRVPLRCTQATILLSN